MSLYVEIDTPYSIRVPKNCLSQSHLLALQLSQTHRSSVIPIIWFATNLKYMCYHIVLGYKCNILNCVCTEVAPLVAQLVINLPKPAFSSS